MTDVKQYFSTEGYPESYQNDQSCTFTFVAPPGERIAVVFEDVRLEIGRDPIVLRKSRQTSLEFIICQNCNRLIVYLNQKINFSNINKYSNNGQ